MEAKIGPEGGVAAKAKETRAPSEEQKKPGSFLWLVLGCFRFMLHPWGHNGELGEAHRHRQTALPTPIAA